ncbi:hypothetical protein HK097_011443 [Rhizophlyctis rosea]|uniref:AA9 family lytic polysaccharide monooxygenase n=1 Tax=Rhizophlyctis rosea TaxID=64517 RepID=A0AAD5S834_9FUNG|nr:hypothetical protein HK097_011443 [Rhizophlyctis rosea]
MKAVLALPLLAAAASAHTLVRSVYVNGVDQGTGYGIRPPAFNGPPLANGQGGQGAGYQNSPVRDLTSSDMQCNVLGDIPAADTINVVPGDIVSFEWGHESRLSSDDTIDKSHVGAVLVYISEYPLTSNNWVKIFEEGEYAKGQWAVVPKLTGNKGVHSVRIPAGLKPGNYILRPELITLHEAEVSHVANANRGNQLYMECIQIKVGGSGTVSLPSGVSFPGAYSYSDPGIVYNVYYTSAGAPAYKVPGPTVWSGAAASVANPALGAKKGALTVSGWNTWVGKDRTVTWVNNGVTSKSAYVPNWGQTAPPRTTTQAPPVTTTSTPPVTTTTPVRTTTPPPVTTTTTRATTTTTRGGGSGAALYGQCGGKNWTGPTTCAQGTCKFSNDYYSQCLN